MNERQRLVKVQELIDRLLYLQGGDREDFLKYLDAMFEAYPVPRKVTYFPNLKEMSNEEGNLSDAD